MTEQEFNIAKSVLIEILQDSKQSVKVKLKAAELLLTLEDRQESARWDPLSSTASKRE